MFDRDVTNKQRKALVQQYKESGLNKTEFADKFGLSATVFDSWIKDDNQNEENDIIVQEQFVEVNTSIMRHKNEPRVFSVEKRGIFIDLPVDLSVREMAKVFEALATI